MRSSCGLSLSDGVAFRIHNSSRLWVIAAVPMCKVMFQSKVPG